MHDNLSGKPDKKFADFETNTAALLVFALEWERHKLERAGRLYRYGSIIVCENCLREYVVDYVGLSLERGVDKRCELCGESALWLFFAYLVDSLKPRLETVRQANRGR